MSKPLAADSPRTGAILSWLREREEEMAGLLSELIAVPTENPPKRNYRVCADLLEKHIREFGLGCERFEPANLKSESDDVPVCLQASFGTGERSLYFHGHYDVVPAQSP